MGSIIMLKVAGENTSTADRKWLAFLPTAKMRDVYIIF